MARKKKNWIQRAIKRPGALRAKAKRAGALNKDGTISVEWLRKMAKGNSLTARQARLALTFRKMRRRRKKK